MAGKRTTSECLAVLNLERPKFAGKSQAEVEEQLAAWKKGALKKAYAAGLHAAHPDRNPDDPQAGEKVQAVREAYKQLLELTVQLKRPDVCPAGHVREPRGAAYCPHCGYCYEDALVSRLRREGITEKTMSELRASGRLETLRALDMDSPAFRYEVRLLMKRQQLGLFGPYSGWS